MATTWDQLSDADKRKLSRWTKEERADYDREMASPDALHLSRLRTQITLIEMEVGPTPAMKLRAIRKAYAEIHAALRGACPACGRPLAA